ncbi:MAG: hypothetical protein KAS78_02300 [Candidatus Pacebacteria bacterium]|nr:hypothetical protein [Candidatus Paceibacterota bacterium]
MSKLYRCAKGCGSIEENNSGQKSVCCEVEMIEIKEEDLFGCVGCCGRCDTGCGDEKE